MVWCGYKNGYIYIYINMSLIDIGLCAQNMITSLSSTVNIIWGGGDLYDHLMSMRIFDLIWISICSNALDSLTILYL